MIPLSKGKSGTPETPESRLFAGMAVQTKQTFLPCRSTCVAMNKVRRVSRITTSPPVADFLELLSRIIRITVEDCPPAMSCGRATGTPDPPKSSGRLAIATRAHLIRSASLTFWQEAQTDDFTFQIADLPRG